MSPDIEHRLNTNVMEIETTGCLIWTGARQILISYKRYDLRRLVYMLFSGSVDDPKRVIRNTCHYGTYADLHRKECDGQLLACVNPRHIVYVPRSRDLESALCVQIPRIIDLATGSTFSTAEMEAVIRKYLLEVERIRKMIVVDERRQSVGLPPIHRSDIPDELFRPITITPMADGAVMYSTEAFVPRFGTADGTTDASDR